MNNEKKISLGQWVSFAISCLTIIGKVIKEIIDIIPEKNA